jgi:uncharacterized protein (TIGR02001 family)
LIPAERDAPGGRRNDLTSKLEAPIMHSKLATFGLALSLASVSATAAAVDLSANIGYNSEYIFRGIPQKTSSAMGGLDLEAGGFYLGTWGADVGDGLEIDYYGGYGFDVGEFSFGVGGTIYTYTGDFDDTYKEVNLSAGWRFLTFDAAIGTYDNFGGPKLDYEYYSLTAEYNGFFGRIATFENDFDGSYYEAGYGDTLSVQDTELFDYSFTVIYSDSTLLGGSSDTNFVLTLSKTFDF